MARMPFPLDAPLHPSLPTSLPKGERRLESPFSSREKGGDEGIERELGVRDRAASGISPTPDECPDSRFIRSPSQLAPRAMAGL